MFLKSVRKKMQHVVVITLLSCHFHTVSQWSKHAMPSPGSIVRPISLGSFRNNMSRPAAAMPKSMVRAMARVGGRTRARVRVRVRVGVEA